MEAGPAHQVNGRAVAATAASVRAILVSAVAVVNRAPATTLNVSSASPLSATTRSSAGHTVMPGTWRCRWHACSAKFSSIRASRPSSGTPCIARRLAGQARQRSGDRLAATDQDDKQVAAEVGHERAQGRRGAGRAGLGSHA